MTRPPRIRFGTDHSGSRSCLSHCSGSSVGESVLILIFIGGGSVAVEYVKSASGASAIAMSAFKARAGNGIVAVIERAALELPAHEPHVPIHVL